MNVKDSEVRYIAKNELGKYVCHLFSVVLMASHLRPFQLSVLCCSPVYFTFSVFASAGMHMYLTVFNNFGSWYEDSDCVELGDVP
jgi:hypothetical protein